MYETLVLYRFADFDMYETLVLQPQSVTFGGSLVNFVTGSSVWADRVAIYVRDVAVPCGFARPWWKLRLRGVVPLGSAKHAGVNAACRW